MKCKQTRAHQISRIAPLAATLAVIGTVTSCSPETTSHPASANSTFPPASISTATEGPSRPPIFRESEPRYTTDVTDQRRLAGLADTIFVGTVTGNNGIRFRHEIIAVTRFSVNVVQALKGNASGVVAVEQEGGHDPQTNITYTIKGDRSLAVGASYLFATIMRPKEAVYSVISIYGDTPLTRQEVAAATTNSPPAAVVRMRESISHQIPS